LYEEEYPRSDWILQHIRKLRWRRIDIHRESVDDDFGIFYDMAPYGVVKEDRRYSDLDRWEYRVDFPTDVDYQNMPAYKAGLRSRNFFKTMRI